MFVISRASHGLFRGGGLAALLAFVLGLAPPARSHTLYLMADNHTDYNWNAPASAYDASMLDELDYHLAQVDATSSHPFDEQSRYTADSWWYLYLYEQNRTEPEFADLIAKMQSGHITIPLNPFVTLYGAMSTEMAIRAGYYPGRVAREHGVEFPLVYASVENDTIPWGLASIFAGSGVRYAWKGVCDCVDEAPHEDVPAELFHWLGPDDAGLLMKWYRLVSSNQDRGGYAEARANLDVPAMNGEIARTQADQPGISATGLFGTGWDDVSYKSMDLVNAVRAFNAGGGNDTAVVSNGIDFFQRLEASGEAANLPSLQGGWGADWDMWPASLAERTARQRRAFEKLRTVEALWSLAEWLSPGSWQPVQRSLETALTSTWKYFEHGWAVAAGGPSLAQMAADKEQWTQDLESAVATALADAEAILVQQFETPDEDRVAVFNPLAFDRNDVVDLAVASAGPWRVTDLATGLAVPSQLVTRDGQMYLHWLASNVPSLGYRVYRVAPGTPPALPDAASVDLGARVIESQLYRVALGTRGQITSAREKSSEPDVELAGAAGLNDWGSGALVTAMVENAGPVSSTLRIELANPNRTVRVTLYAGLDRIEIENEVRANLSGFRTYTFELAMMSPQIHFEEVGAIARPGLISQGGDFLPGTRADRLPLNHFVAFEKNGYHAILSNADSYAMKVGASTSASFDLPTSRVQVVVTDVSPGADLTNQGGDDRFLNRFALRAASGPFSAAEAMRMSLAHQNPLHALALPRSQSGPLTASVQSFLAVDDPEVVVTAFKPAEEADRGLVVRAWELANLPVSFHIDATAFGPAEAYELTLVENDVASVGIASGQLQVTASPRQIKTWRFLPSSSSDTACDDGLDNDGDGLVDHPDDSGCTDPSDPSEQPDCKDGLDNDGDGLVDFPEDPGCYNRDSLTESPQCNDGIDNDSDSLIDYPDDPNCLYAWQSDESYVFRVVCGLGVELALVLAPLLWLARRKNGLHLGL